MAKSRDNGITVEEINHEMIEVHGARVHNLKNIDISIPKNKLVVITGISGSGKSSLAFDTIYAEGPAPIHGNLRSICTTIYRRYGTA
jgi:excinuclease ABC subunit A